VLKQIHQILLISYGQLSFIPRNANLKAAKEGELQKYQEGKASEYHCLA